MYLFSTAIIRVEGLISHNQPSSFEDPCVYLTTTYEWIKIKRFYEIEQCNYIFIKASVFSIKARHSTNGNVNTTSKCVLIFSPLNFFSSS